MSRVLVDTYAWIEYFEGTKRGARVKELIDRHTVVYTCPMVIAEIQSKVTRLVDAAEADRRTDFILSNSIVVDHDTGLGKEAGRIHADLKPKIPGIGLADCFILASARAKGVRVLTGDNHFKGISDAVLL